MITRKSTVPVLLFSVMLTTHSCAVADTSSARTIWRLLDGITESMADRETIQTLMGTQFERATEQHYGTDYAGTGSPLSDGTIVGNFTLVRPTNGARASFRMRMSGRCHDIAEIRQFYPRVQQTEGPLHGRPDAVFTYTEYTRNGQLHLYVNTGSLCLTAATVEFVQ